MLEQAKGITTDYIMEFIDKGEHYFYEDLHKLAGELVLKDTHDTNPIVINDGDGYSGTIISKFKSKVEGVPDITVSDFYGSCSFCDTLTNIYEDSDELEIIRDLATMVLHTIQSMEEQVE
ncbi:hypothetical protein [Staphylococcus phage vB_SauM-V1SA19]|nr:hypothetical protein [Staphylococcus phage vB_SauM-V1SA19]